MTGKKSAKVSKKKPVAQQQASQQQTNQTHNEEPSSPPSNVKKEQPPPPQTVKKILKTENDEAKTLKTVFKSNPDLQMKEFIKKAVVKPNNTQQASKAVLKTPADTHPPAVAQELLDTDDDVADNLCKLFKASKSYKNI